MSDFDPCSSLDTEANRRITELESLGTNTIDDELDDFALTLQNYGGAVTSYSTLNSSLENLTNDAVGFNSSTANQIERFVGSCLDGIFSDLFEYRDAIGTHISSAIGTVLGALPDVSLYSGLETLKALINSLGIGDILDEIDKLLGCMSDQTNLANCLTNITAYTNRVTSFQNTYYVTDTGMFDVPTYVDGVSGISSNLKTNLTLVSSHTDTLNSSIITDIDDSLKSNIRVPSRYW